jgi:hypothetical protein
MNDDDITNVQVLLLELTPNDEVNNIKRSVTDLKINPITGR